MLARKYDNYAWQEQPAEQYEAPQPVRRRRRKPDKMKLIRSGLFKILAVVIGGLFRYGSAQRGYGAVQQ